MLTYITEKHTVFYPDFRIFTSKCVDEISTYIKLQKKEKTYNSVVIDMSKIQVLTTEFFDLINGCPNKIILINTSAEILAVLNLMGYDKKLFKEIFAYSGWVLNGNLAVMGYTQGLNMLLNVFFGPVVNAARGIAVSVQTICCGFCNNFQTALNPQITKNYAQGNMSYVHSLLVKSSKFSLYILFIVILPLMFETMTVLKLWLGNVPDHTVVFLRIMLCISLFTALSNPVIIAVHATGKLRRFQLIEGNMLLLIVPIAYIVLKFSDDNLLKN